MHNNQDCETKRKVTAALAILKQGIKDRSNPQSKDQYLDPDFLSGLIDGAVSVLQSTDTTSHVDKVESPLNSLRDSCDRTWNKYDPVYNSNDMDDRLELLHAALLLSSEVGELLDAFKGWHAYGRALSRTNVAEEIGDCLYALDRIAKINGISLESCVRANISKLKARYPEKYSQKRANDRDKEAEDAAVASELEQEWP